MLTLKRIFKEQFNFEKWHGAENDFLFVALPELLSSLKEPFTLQGWEKAVVELCHRNTGFGADGIVVWTHNAASQETGAGIWNSDGSRAQTCGNALRCLAGVLIEKQLWDGRSAHDVLTLSTTNNTLALTQASFARLLSATQSEPDGEVSASVAMGRAVEQRSGLLRLATEKIATQKTPPWMQTISALSFVQLANPHLVVQIVPGSFASFNAAHFSEMGRFFQSNEICQALNIPLSNIGFVEGQANTTTSSAHNAVVYERGAGLTQCCGSGGCAMRVALKEAAANGIPDVVQLKMPGGLIGISESGAELVLTGPAMKVARVGAAV